MWLLVWEKIGPENHPKGCVSVTWYLLIVPGTWHGIYKLQISMVARGKPRCCVVQLCLAVGQ